MEYQDLLPEKVFEKLHELMTPEVILAIVPQLKVIAENTKSEALNMNGIMQDLRFDLLKTCLRTGGSKGNRYLSYFTMEQRT